MYFSGVPWWVITCTVPGRLTYSFGKLTLLTKYLARAMTSRYSGVPGATTSIPAGTVAACSGLTTQTPRISGASSRAFS